jgi:hypothetical protein
MLGHRGSVHAGELSMNNQLVKISVVGAFAAFAALSAQAQLGKPTDEELARRGNGPGPTSNSAANSAPGSNIVQPPDAAPPSDPRDFSGYWRMNMGGGRGGGAPGGGGRGGGAPGGAPGSAGGAPGGRPGGPGGGAGGVAPGGGGDFNPTGNVGAAGRLPDRILCLPQAGTQVGVDGPLLLVQTPEQITWASEEMHTIRRIFLTGDYSKNFKSNYYGEALAHWDGNTLVVETAGLKSLPAGSKMIERWNKSADGKTLTMQQGTEDASGKLVGAMRSTALQWRANDQVYEWMCEDYNDEWLPGGTDYDDQVGNKPAQNEQVKK